MSFTIPNCAFCAELTLDLDAIPTTKCVHCKQSDAGSRFIKIIPQKNGTDWLPADAAALLRITKPDTTTAVADCTVLPTGTFVLLPECVGTEPGVATADVLYYTEDTQIATATFFIIIEESGAATNSIMAPEAAEPLYQALRLIRELEKSIYTRIMTIRDEESDPFWQTFYAEDSTSFSFYKFPPLFDGEKFYFADDTCYSGSADYAYEAGYTYFITDDDEQGATFCKLNKDDGYYYDRYAHLFTQASEWLEIEEAAAERASLKAGEAATSAYNAQAEYNKAKAIYDELKAAFPERFEN